MKIEFLDFSSKIIPGAHNKFSWLNGPQNLAEKNWYFFPEQAFREICDSITRGISSWTSGKNKAAAESIFDGIPT